MLNNFSEMVVLVTGGTKGIGRATVESFVKTGAKVYGTYYWGDNLDELEACFSLYPNRPTFIQSDISDKEDTIRLIKTIVDNEQRIDVMVANAAFAPQFKDSYEYRGLLDSIEHNSWPLITYLDVIKQFLGQFPRYVVATTSEGHRNCHINGYDYVAASKAVLETLVKYISARGDVIINCVSPGVVDTEAFELVFGKKAQDFIRKFDPGFIIQPEEVANVSVALCSGLMDAVRGQVIVVDNGRMFTDNFTKWIAMLDQYFIDK